VIIGPTRENRLIKPFFRVRNSCMTEIFEKFQNKEGEIEQKNA